MPWNISSSLGFVPNIKPDEEFVSTGWPLVPQKAFYGIVASKKECFLEEDTCVRAY